MFVFNLVNEDYYARRTFLAVGTIIVLAHLSVKNSNPAFFSLFYEIFLVIFPHRTFLFVNQLGFDTLNRFIIFSHQLLNFKNYTIFLNKSEAEIYLSFCVFNILT